MSQLSKFIKQLDDIDSLGVMSLVFEVINGIKRLKEVIDAVDKYDAIKGTYPKVLEYLSDRAVADTGYDKVMVKAVVGRVLVILGFDKLLKKIKL